MGFLDKLKREAIEEIEKEKCPKCRDLDYIAIYKKGEIVKRVCLKCDYENEDDN